jgi:hypothetical protein
LYAFILCILLFSACCDPVNDDCGHAVLVLT